MPHSSRKHRAPHHHYRRHKSAHRHRPRKNSRRCPREVLAGKGKPGRIPPFWDGHATERIVDVLLKNAPVGPHRKSHPTYHVTIRAPRDLPLRTVFSLSTNWPLHGKPTQQVGVAKSNKHTLRSLRPDPPPARGILGCVPSANIAREAKRSQVSS
jgi:hypothetical protein